MSETFVNLSLGLAALASESPAATALILPDREVSRGELDAMTWRSVRYLHEAGVRPGRVVGVSVSDELSFVLALLGAMRIGATVLPLPGPYSAAQHADAIVQSGAQLLLTDAADPPHAPVPVARIGLAGIDAMSSSPDRRLGLDGAPEPWRLILGSGSTGKPRLIPMTHANQYALAQWMTGALAFGPTDRVLAMPMVQLAHSTSRVISALLMGASAAVMRPDPRRLPELCRRHRFTVVHGTPYHVEMTLMALSEPAVDALTTVRCLTLTSASVTSALRSRIRRLLTPNLYVLYGTNEAGTIALAGPPEVFDLPGTIGRPVPGVEVRIEDERALPVPPGGIGRLRVRSPQVVSGYFRDDPGTRQAFDAGWFAPGDLASVDLDDHLVLHGRADEMMIFNGINIYPAEIERVMAEHPAIADVAAMPLEHPVHQQVPVCAVVLRDGHRVSGEALNEYAAARLGPRRPQAVALLRAIPRNEQGKPIRTRLRSEVLVALGWRDVRAAPDRRGDSPEAASQPVGQPEIRLAFDFGLPESANVSWIDQWTVQVLESAERLDASNPESIDAPAVAMAVLERALRWATGLARLGHLPLFQTPRVLSLAPGEAPGQWKAGIAFPWLDQLPTHIADGLVSRSIALVLRASTTAPVPETRDEMFALAGPLLRWIGRALPVGKSTLPLLRAAHCAGIPFMHLGRGVFQLGFGRKARRVERSTTDADSAIGARLSHDKAVSAALLRQAGLPAPVHQVARSVDEARSAAARIGWPVVVKPADTDRGEGVIVDVSDEPALEAAFNRAVERSKTRRVLVERQVRGVCHRLFIANGRLLYAVKRLPMSVRGDGLRTVAQLVDAELERQRRKPPWSRSELRPLDAAAHAQLAREQLSAETVPAAGRWVALRRIETTEAGGVDEDVTEIVHPENLRIAIAAARLFDLQIAGIDLISEDVTVPWHANGAIVNEVNFAPLLGGGEISRARLPDFLSRIIDGDGRIPVELYAGGRQAWARGVERWKALRAQGIAAALTRADLTVSPSGETMPMAFVPGACRRARALALSHGIGAIVIVADPGEAFAGRWPIEYVDRIVDLSRA